MNCELSGDKDLPSRVAIWDTAIPQVKLQHKMTYLHRRESTRTNSTLGVKNATQRQVLQPLSSVLLQEPPNLPAIVLFNFSLPPNRCSAWRLWGSAWSTGAAIIIQHSQGKTRAQCQSTRQPVAGKVTRRALYWIPAEAEEGCPGDPEATAGQWWKADSTVKQSWLHIKEDRI